MSFSARGRTRAEGESAGLEMVSSNGEVSPPSASFCLRLRSEDRQLDFDPRGSIQELPVGLRTTELNRCQLSIDFDVSVLEIARRSISPTT